MACASLTALLKTCGNTGVIGGLEKMYAIAFADLEPVSGSTTGDVYTVSTGGLVSDIGVKTAKSFVEVGLLKSSSSLAESMTKDPTKAVLYFTQTFSLVLAEMTQENKAWVESVMNQPIVIIVKSRNGKFYVAGLNGLMEASKIDSTTGAAEGDGNSYTLEFTGIDTQLVKQVDPTLIPTLLVPAT